MSSKNKTISLNTYKTLTSSIKHFQENTGQKPIDLQELRKYINYNCKCGGIITTTTMPYHCTSCHSEYKEILKNNNLILEKLI